ncbi:MAG: hypothetical protein WC549_00400 [Actinomycetota bacterium]
MDYYYRQYLKRHNLDQTTTSTNKSIDVYKQLSDYDKPKKERWLDSAINKINNGYLIETY